MEPRRRAHPGLSFRLPRSGARITAAVLLASMFVVAPSRVARAQDPDDAVVSDPLVALDKAVRRLYHRASPAVVRVDAERVLALRVVNAQGLERVQLEDLLRRCTARESVTATGFLVDEEGLVITTTSAVDRRSESVRVTFSGGVVRDAHLIGMDRIAGVALLRVLPVPGVKPLHFHEGDVDLGSVGILIGRSLDDAPSLGQGFVSATGRCAGDYDGYFLAGVPLRAGDAGAPLLDVRGRVLGMAAPVQSDPPRDTESSQLLTLDHMVREESSATDALPTFVPGRELARIVTALRDHGTVPRGLAGVLLDGGEDAPPIVARVPDGMPAAAAGIQVGDTVVSLDGNPVRTVRQLVLFVQRRAPGTSVRLTLRDLNGEVRTVNLVLSEFREQGPATPGWFNGIGVANGDGPHGSGLEVRSVEPGSIASVTGVRPGDFIVSIAGRPVASEEDYQNVATSYDLGAHRSIEVELLREGKRITVTLR
jgi:serine protease Do